MYISALSMDIKMRLEKGFDPIVRCVSTESQRTVSSTYLGYTVKLTSIKLLKCKTEMAIDPLLVSTI